jgi:hypothetical protein
MPANVVIDDGTVLFLASNTRAVKEIPCLAGKKMLFQPKAGGCGACAARKEAQRKNTMRNIKMCLATLSAEKRTVLKEILHAQTATVVYVDAANKTIRVDF